MGTEGATIEYATAVDDVVAFNQFHMKASRTGKRTRVTLTAFAGVFSFLFNFGVLMVLNAFALTDRPLGLRVVLPLAAAGALVVALRTRGRLDRSVSQSVRRMLSEGQNKALLGWHRLALGERALRMESDASKSEVLYGALERIDETETHVFIYTGATTAYPVPKAAVSSGELTPFVAELKRRVADAA